MSEKQETNIFHANVFVIGKVLQSIIHCDLSMNSKSLSWQAFKNSYWIVSIIIIVQNILYGLGTSLPFNVAAKEVTMVMPVQRGFLSNPQKQVD